MILVRRAADGPRVLMGQRGARAAFMPEMFVFPGGAVDDDDRALAGETALDAETARRLAVETPPELVPALARAAVRELWEETGLVLGRPDAGAATRAVPAGWRGFSPPGSCRGPRRCASSSGQSRRRGGPGASMRASSWPRPSALAAGGDDFAGAGGELAHLQWLDIAAARALPLPFITEVVLSEVEALLAEPGRARGVPFFHQSTEGPRFSVL